MHARLKNEFTEDEKYHNLMTWLVCRLLFFLPLGATGRLGFMIVVLPAHLLII